MKRRGKSFFRVVSIILSVVLIITTSSISFAKRETKEQLNHIDVYVNGSISIETQINGVSQGVQKGVIKMSNVSAILVDNGITKTYDNFSTQTQSGSTEMEFHKEVTSFSTSAEITIKGTMKCEELGIDTTFSKTFSGADIIAAVEECPMNSGCDFRITEDEVMNTVTHNVVFKTEQGGKINDGTDDISYTNIIDAADFPNIPTTSANENYVFEGWYDENGKLVDEFPSKVTQDYIFIAKWKQLATPTPEPTKVPTPEPTKVPTPTPTVEPTKVPTSEPTKVPTPTPTVEPTKVPTPEPTKVPTPTPTVEPTKVPTPEPTKVPTPKPIIKPTKVPTPNPTVEPTKVPTPEPTKVPTPTPTLVVTPTSIPTLKPTKTLVPTPVATSTTNSTPEPTNVPTPIVTPTLEPIVTLEPSGIPDAGSILQPTPMVTDEPKLTPEPTELVEPTETPEIVIVEEDKIPASKPSVEPKQTKKPSKDKEGKTQNNSQSKVEEIAKNYVPQTGQSDTLKSNTWVLIVSSIGILSILIIGNKKRRES